MVSAGAESLLFMHYSTERAGKQPCFPGCRKILFLFPAADLTNRDFRYILQTGSPPPEGCNPLQREGIPQWYTL